jgi:hypothetical protein
MSKPVGNTLLPIAFGLGCLFAISVALFYPGYASDAGILGMLVFLEIVLAAILNHEQRFFLLLILVSFLPAREHPRQDSGPPHDGSCLGQALSRGCVLSQRSPLPSRGIPLSCTFLYHRGGGFMLSIVIRARRLV